MISVITESCSTDTSVYLTLVRGQRKTAWRVDSLVVRKLGCVGLWFSSLWGHPNWNRHEYVSMLRSCVAEPARWHFAVWQVVPDKLKALCPSKCRELLNINTESHSCRLANCPACCHLITLASIRSQYPCSEHQVYWFVWSPLVIPQLAFSCTAATKKWTYFSSLHNNKLLTNCSA